MCKFKKILALMLAGTMAVSLCACSNEEKNEDETNKSENYDKTYIEETLNLDNNEEQTWTYQSNADAWVLSVVSAVAYPELPDQQGVSACVPGAYVKDIDTNGDSSVDVTGAAGYGSQNNQLASTSHAADGYINVSCGNRGKQDSTTDEGGNTYYTGDAPSCLVDQKAAARYVKYNILLGNLPGNVDYFVSTGGSGGGAHATMFAATSNNSDYYDYQIEAGAVGVYKNEDGSYSTTVSIDGTATECTGTDISTWVNYEDISSVSIALSDIASYRTNGASKAVPGFDVIDYGQEDYVFGDSEQDARHWNTYLLEIFEEYADTLAPLFNK